MNGDQLPDDVIASGVLQDYIRLLSGGRKPLVAIQGGGAKGGWQGGVLSQLLNAGIRPVCCYGSSAGGINAVLVSSWLESGGGSVFRDFWSALADGRMARLGRVGPSSVANVGRRIWSGISERYRPSGATRLPALVEFEKFREEIGRVLCIPKYPTQHTYLYATNIDGDLPPLLDSQNLFSFHWAVGKEDAHSVLGGRNSRVDVLTAVATSCCLPVVKPNVINGVHAADGGIYSNLPIDAIFSQGTHGGTECTFVLATPLCDMKPDCDLIDYKTVFLLTQLKSDQLEAMRRYRRGARGGFLHPFRYPVFVVQPKAPLKSGLLKGFGKPKTMAADIALGEVLGKEFVHALEAADRGNTAELRRFHLLDIELPDLPEEPPALSDWWVSMVNREW